WTRWSWRASRPTPPCIGRSWTTPTSWPASSTRTSWSASCPPGRRPPPPPERGVRALPASPFVYPIVDAARLRGRDVAAVVDVLARGGARLVQVRTKAGTDRERLALARAAVAAARLSGARLVVNDRADIAVLAEADGVHVGQDDLSPADVRAVVGPAMLLGVSTHGLAQLEASAS